jgi:hypothetical protein
VWVLINIAGAAYSKIISKSMESGGILARVKHPQTNRKIKGI